MGIERRIRGYARKIRSLPANTAHRIVSIPPIQRRLETHYRHSLRRHALLVPKLAGLDARICEGLERDGIFVTSIE